MACTPTPTQTLYEVVTTTTVSTSFSDILTTIPANVSTALSTFCGSSTTDVNGTTTCLLTQSEEITTTIQDQEVSTIQSPFVIQVPVTLSEPTSTLFSTCPTVNGTSNPPSPPPSSSPTSPPPTSPPASLVVSQVSSTLADGSVVVTLVTYTSTAPPAVSTVPTSSGGSGGLAGDHHDNSVRGDLGPIVGGVLGGFVGLIALASLIWFIWRKRDSIRSLYPKEQPSNPDSTSLHPSWRHSKATSPPPEFEPKPYQYGLVGRKVSTPSRNSSPAVSPAPTRPQSLAHSGLSPSPYSPGFPYIPATPNALQTSPALSPVQPTVPTPSSPLPPAQRPAHHPSGSVTSVGTAVSYPYPIFPTAAGPSDTDADGDASASVLLDHRPKRMSLTLANWNPETDGELFPRVSEGGESVRMRRGAT